MSKMYVNELVPRDAAGISIDGHVVQYKTVSTTTPVTLSTGVGGITILSIDYTPLNANNKLVISVNIPNLRKTTGAGVNAWFTGVISVDGVTTSDGSIFGALGYPETYNDQRYMAHSQIEISAYSGTKTIRFVASASSTGSEWIVSYQNAVTRMMIMEIAQ